MLCKVCANILFFVCLDSERKAFVCGFCNVAFIFYDGRDYVHSCHIEHRHGFDIEKFAIVLHVNVFSRFEFRFAENVHMTEQFDVLFARDIRECVYGGGQIQQASLFCFFRPFVRIVVAVEDDFAVLGHHSFDDIGYALVDILDLLEFVGKLLELLCHYRVENDVYARNGLRRAGHTELEFISRESKRRSTVAVGRVHSKFRQDVHADFNLAFCTPRIRAAVCDCLHNAREFFSEEHAHDCGRCFVCSETMVV